MEFKKDETGYQASNLNLVDHKGHFIESNAGHISVQTTSPFKMKTRESEYAADQCFKHINNFNILSKKLPKEACSSATSKLLVNQIIKDNNIDVENLNLKENHATKTHCVIDSSNYNKTFSNHSVVIENSVHIFNCNDSSASHEATPVEKSIAPVTVENGYSMNQYLQSNSFSTITFHSKKRAEKTTNCRPVLGYSQEFVNKAIEQNARLQKLIKKLVIARKQEKETEAWNNYINQLKNKHGNHYNTYPVSNHAEYIVECDTNNISRHANHYDQLLQEVYLTDDIVKLDNNCIHQKKININSYCCYPACYPISSQGRLIMLQKQQKRNILSQDSHDYSTNMPFCDNTVIAKKDFKNKKDKNTFRNFKMSCDKKIQTDVTNATLTRLQKRNSQEKLKHLNDRLLHNVEKLPIKSEGSNRIDERFVLASIENKLDTLIASLNLFLDEAQVRSVERQCRNCQSENVNNKNIGNTDKIPRGQSDTNDEMKAEQLYCDKYAENSTKNITHKSSYKLSRNGNDISDIIIEEINNSKRAKDEIESLLSGTVLHPCPVNVSLDIPTKERYTEVTESLSKAMLNVHDRSVSVQEIRNDGSSEHQKTTKAVNTDPLGLMALLHVSTDTVKQLMSYMPNVLYYSSLPMINASQRRADFACNICGAAFGRPTQLSDYIQGHDLGQIRNCCVCRHLLDIQALKPVGRFRCQYCGEHFTRAYCCNLHEESCAKSFGLKHDVTPSLMVLK